MSIHRYEQNSVIDEITFRKADNGSLRAYLHASDKTTVDALSEIKDKLSAHGWQCIPSTQAGKAVLEVRGFSREQKLAEELAKNNFIHGNVRIEQTAEDNLSFKDQFKTRSLQASGLFYLLGDAAYMTYGYQKAHWEEVLAGLMYLGGSVALVGYGNHNNASIEIQDIAQKMQEEVQKKSVDLPDNCSLSAITKDQDRGLIKKADDIFTRYPSEIMNGFFALAGFSIIAAALRKGVLPKPELLAGLSAKDAMSRIHSAKLDIGVGVMTAGSGAVAALIKEKAPDPDAPKKHGLEAIWEKIQEKPLSVAGIGYIVSTCFHALSSYKEYGVAKANNDQVMLKSVPFRAAFVGCSLIAELLMAVSSKGHGDGVVIDKSVDESIISLAADLIVKQPENEREHLIEYLSLFLGRKDVLAMKDSVVKDMLQKQVELQQKNPWAECAETIHPKKPTEKPTTKSPMNFVNSGNEQAVIGI